MIVPEAETQVYSSLGFRWDQIGIDQRRDAQRAIYRLQIEQERRIAEAHPNHVLLMDRGTIDGAAYWPDGPSAYWEDLGTTADRELARYDRVILLESSAAIGLYDGDVSNRVRFEDAEAALVNAKRLEEIWAIHPRRVAIRAMPDFEEKIQAVMRTIFDAT